MRFGLTNRQRWHRSRVSSAQTKRYAWYPVKLASGEWAWLEMVWRRDFYTPIHGFKEVEHRGL